MKARKLMMLLAAALLTGVGDAAAAWDASAGVYYLKTSDGLESPYTVDGSITFKSQSGATVAGYRDCGVVFAPAREGEVITITVESIDLSGQNYLLLYDKEITEIKSGVSDGVDQSRYLPAGWVKKYQTGSAGETYTSTDPSGKLSFGFHTSSADGQTGFTITVSSVSPKDMEYQGAEMSLVDAPFRGEKNAPLSQLTVRTDGANNPFTLNSAIFSFSALKAQGISNFRIYKGAKVTPENLLATADENATTLSLSDIVLRSGANVFTLTGNLPPSLTGELAAAEVTGLTIGGESREVTPATGNVSILNEIRLSADPTEYVISEPTQFFDDGGAQGKISNKFTGQVTFVPATPGDAIKIDFTKLDLFNTSSTGLNDVLKIYNGRTADEANLNCTLLTDKRVVKSTAADGSLTVKLVSTTGIPKEGFEATVSEFIPGDMTMTGITATAYDEATVSAYQQKAPVMLLDMLTDNTSNALNVSKITVNATNPQLLSGARVYYLGESTTLASGSAEYGTLQPGAATMTFTGDVTLREGHNYFAVTADIAETAVNDDTFTLTASAETRLGTTAATGEAAKSVRNVWNSISGTKELSLRCPWSFLPTYDPAVTYAVRYLPGEVDEITVFKPTGAGEVAQIDFSSFELGSTATFDIYSGTGVNSANLLWSVSKDTRTTGPGMTIRSTAADGSLTVVFNPHTTYSYACEAGWKATVRPFLNHDMSIVGSTATRPSTAVLAPGSTGEKLLDFTLSTEGTLSTASVKTVNLSIAGAEALSSVSVYASVFPDRQQATLFGVADNPTAATAIAGQRELTEGQNYFWVEGNVKSDAAVDTEVRVGVTSVVTGTDETVAIADGNPEGSRTVKSILNLAAGDHTVDVAQDIVWYDDGGESGNISSRIKATYTFVPTRPGCAVTLNAEEFSIGNGRMYVYNGREAKEENLVGSLTGFSTMNGPKNLLSDAPDGSLTVTVSGPTGSTLAGFKILVGLHERTDFTAGEITAATPASATLMRGSSGNVLLGYNVPTSGDQGEAEVSDVTFSIAGSNALTSLTLWQMPSGDVFVPSQAVKIADLTPAATVTVTNTTALAARGDHWFFLTGNVDATAAAGTSVKASLTAAKFNGTAAEVAANENAFTVKAGIKGTFTVGADGDYATFKAATDALAEGVEGAVTFNILAGTYAENLVVTNVPGASASCPITFRSESGNRADVNITGRYDAVEKAGIVRISGTPYVTVENVTVSGGSQGFESCVALTGSRNVTLRGNAISAEKSNAYSGSTNLVRETSQNVLGDNCDDLLIENNLFSGGRIALYLGGTGFIALPPERGLIVRNNTVADAASKGIYVSCVNDAVITGNSVTNAETLKSYTAFDLYRLRGETVVSGNRVVSRGNADSTGLYFRSDSRGSEETPIRVFNNVIDLTGSTSYTGRALQVDNSSDYIDFAFNTFRIGGTGGYAFCTSGSDLPTGISLRDNIFVNDCTAGNLVMMFWNAADHTGYSFEKNAVWSSNTAAFCKNDTETISLAAFNSLIGSDSNFAARPDFVSDTDLHLLSAGTLQCGIPVDYVTVDADGLPRPAVNPTLGAYEYAAISTDTPVMEAGYPAVSNITVNSADVTTKWSQNGVQYALAVAWSDDATAPTAAQLKAQHPVDVTAGGETLVTLDGLESSTLYKPFFLSVSAAGTESAVTEGPAFTTARLITTLEIGEQEEVPVINAGETVTVTPEISGGDLPYSYEWKTQENEEAGTAVTLSATPEVSQRYKLTVTSADGQTATAFYAVRVLGEARVATFDDNYIAPGADLYPAAGEGELYSGSYSFEYMSDKMGGYKFWSGYIFSNQQENSYSGLTDQFRSAPGGGYDSENFAVGYPQGMSINVTNTEEGMVIPGTYVTNAAYAYDSMLRGDGYTDAFKEGSWFAVTARGTHPDGSVSTLEFPLADYRPALAADRYILNTWQWLDLRPLGVVTDVTFTFDGSEKNRWGLLTPSYVCLDNFGALPTMEEYEVTLTDDGLDISDFFTLADDGATVSYAISPLTYGETLPLSLDGDVLSWNGEAPDAPVAVMASKTRKGESEYVRLNVSRELIDGIGGVTAGRGFKVVGVDGCIRILTAADDYVVEVFTPAGLRIHASEGNSGNTAVSLAEGVYIVRVSDGTSSRVARIILK